MDHGPQGCEVLAVAEHHRKVTGLGKEDSADKL